MDIKTIKSEKDYKEALSYIESKIDSGVKAGSPEAEKLEIIITLVRDYETNVFPKASADPIDVLEFVMEQRNLTQEDLVTYIGSRSKVSEVLARRRPLSLNMIKALHKGLNIPADVLINQSKQVIKTNSESQKYPIREMVKRGYLSIVSGVDDTTENIERILSEFFQPVGDPQKAFALLSKAHYIRSAHPMNPYALQVWATEIIRKAQSKPLDTEFKEGSITIDVLRKISDFSDEENAFEKARKSLNQLGISFVVEPHMSQTYLDGAVIMLKNQNPVIGMTIRQDRLDNFWFTLIHEMAHIALHYQKGTNFFYDDMESFEPSDPREIEADRLAINALIPEEKWKKSPASILPSPDAAKLLAKELSIHPAIVAGRMRFERKHYYFLNNLVGKGEVRKQFPEVNWKK